jgi:hypothetical protein
MVIKYMLEGSELEWEARVGVCVCGSSGKLESEVEREGLRYLSVNNAYPSRFRPWGIYRGGGRALDHCLADTCGGLIGPLATC